MSIRQIITVPDETLKKISEPIEKVGVNEKKAISEPEISPEQINNIIHDIKIFMWIFAQCSGITALSGEQIDHRVPSVPSLYIYFWIFKPW